MGLKKPQVFLVGETQVIREEMDAFLAHIDQAKWTTNAATGAEEIAEVMGRICYNSFEPGVNRNISTVRKGNAKYLGNIKNQKHGSVFEHAQLNFVISDVTRVFTHELITHRVGTAKSQESLRYVRLTEDFDMYYPMIFEGDDFIEVKFNEAHKYFADLQKELGDHFDLDKEDSFKRKKELTSAMRRLAPIGLCTTIGWSCNMRSLHNIVQRRTAPMAEEEIRLVFNLLFEKVRHRYPAVFGDFVGRPAGEPEQNYIFAECGEI